MIYIGLFKVLFKHTQKNIENLKMMVEGEENIPRTFVPSLKLKIKQLKAFKKYVVVFYSLQISDEVFYNSWYYIFGNYDD